MNELMSNFSVMLPELVLAVLSCALLLFGLFQENDPRAPHAVQRRTLMAGFVALLIVMGLVAWRSSGVTAAFDGVFMTGPFAAFMKMLVLSGAALTLFMSGDYLKTVGVRHFEFPVLVCFATLGMMMTISANHFLVLYLGLELFSLSTYVLVSIKKETSLPSEAALKYFVLGAVASGFILFGISLIYGFTGSVQYETIALVLERDINFEVLDATNIGVMVGLVFLLCGLAFKVSAAPFHMWTPDVYQGAPTIVTAFMAMAPKAAVFAVLTRFLVTAMWGATIQWQQIIVALSVLSMVIGAFGALTQTNIKRLLGYSTIGHVGYILLGLAAGSEKGVTAMLVYLVLYLIMNAGIFAGLMMMRQKDRMLTDIVSLEGFARSHPLVGFGLAVLLFSMAGIPPLAGFFGKFLVIKAVIDAEMVVLGIIAVLTSVVAAYYYIRIIAMMYMQEPAEQFDQPFPQELRVTMACSTIIILLFVFLPEALINVATTAARSLFLG